ncbi:DUF4258 domain-containing protein [Sulfurovum sp.]|uniref:DUF4258 domain-containing protein n=1 Tax=Sulfurovum sp. TaxID=1969726 RepID=UPI0025FBB3F0|nr:DUF4258 domain-containing protein [Sulfurovum sp.]
MKFKLSVHAKDVMENRNIIADWVYNILDNPSVVIKIKEDEVHLYGIIDEYNARCLKVVVNPLKSLVITTYFDRKMKKKGCK